MPEFKFTVEELKVRLDRYLAERLKDTSRSQIQRDIEAGLVMVNGSKVLEGKFVVRLGDEIRYEESRPKNQGVKLEAANIPLKVLYNNHGLLIIDKPAGLAVHPGAGFKGDSLASALLYHFKGIHLVGEEHRPGIVHRLDKDTSGVMLIALTQPMYEFLKDAFAERKIKKEYVALVRGHVESGHGMIDLPVGKSKVDFRKMTTKNPLESKAALTEYRVLEYLRGQDGGSLDEYTLVLVKLHTGRTHQIRVHFASIGHPLMGDELYGPKKTKLEGLVRQFLHAKKIEVQLPDKTWIEAESDLAPDLKEVLIGLDSKCINQL